jgi:hypothetical protein
MDAGYWGEKVYGILLAAGGYCGRMLQEKTSSLDAVTIK